MGDAAHEGVGRERAVRNEGEEPLVLVVVTVAAAGGAAGTPVAGA